MEFCNAFLVSMALAARVWPGCTAVDTVVEFETPSFFAADNENDFILFLR